MSSLPRHRTVSDVMTRRVHVASPTTPFKLLVRLIEENRISAVPIVDRNGIPVGVVSESDLLLKERAEEIESATDLLHPRRHQRQIAKAEGTIAADVMSSPVVTINSDRRLVDAARLMQDRNLRRLVVVDEAGKIVGIVSRSDLLQVFLRSDEDLRDEVVDELIPALMPSEEESIGVDVRFNVVTLEGDVDRKSDVEILARMTKGLDGVVGVVNKLRYRWDDTAARGPQTW